MRDLATIVHMFQTETMNAARLASNPNTILDAVRLEVATLGVLVAIGAGADDDDDPPPGGGAAPVAAPAEVGLAPGL